MYYLMFSVSQRFSNAENTQRDKNFWITEGEREREGGRDREREKGRRRKRKTHNTMHTFV